jgi:hypothetical protein
MAKRDELRLTSFGSRSPGGGGGGSWLSSRQQSGSTRVKVTLLVEEENNLLEPIVLIVQNSGGSTHSKGSKRLLEAVHEAGEPRRLTPDLLANTVAETAV